MKFFLVDIVCITPAKPREQFDNAAIEKLADSMLECDGLLKPLVLKPTGPESFEVIDGHSEYWAAVRVREKDPRKGEMVNAFVVSPKAEEAILRQMQTLKKISSSSESTIKEQYPQKNIVSSNQPMFPVQLLQTVQKELENISRKTERILSLPSQLSGMIQQMERNFEAKIDSLNMRFNQSENSGGAAKTKEAVAKKKEISLTKLRSLAKEQKIKGYTTMDRDTLMSVLKISEDQHQS